jgi:hypothetical protein
MIQRIPQPKSICYIRLHLLRFIKDIFKEVKMDALKPSDLVLAGITGGPVSVVKKSCCSCFQTNTFSKACQVVSIAIAVGSLAAMILMSIHIVQISPLAYAFCAVLLIVCTRLAFSEQKNIELGGYAMQNAIFARNNFHLAQKIDELDPIAKSLAASNHLLAAEVVGIKTVRDQLSVTLRDATLLTGEQRVQLERQVEEVTAFHRENEELKREVDILQNALKGFTKDVKAFATGVDIHKLLLEKEASLQIAQEKMIAQEEALLGRLNREVTRLEYIIKEKKERCMTLAYRVVPLKIGLTMLVDVVARIRVENSEIVDRAQMYAKQLRFEQFRRLKTSVSLS